MEENWKDITGYEGYYQISSNGNVKSCSRFRLGKNGVLIKVNEKMMKLKTSKFGYLCVGLRKDSKKTMFSVHRLVAINFIENPFNKPTVNHKDGNKQNNSVANLEWSTLSEQTNHAIETGLIKPRGKTKYSPEFKKKVYEYFVSNDCSIYKLSQVFEISEKTAASISKGNIERTGIKLSEESVESIRKERLDGCTLKSLSQKYGCSISQIHRIVTKQSRSLVYEKTS
jgi:hypothetical protein